MKILLIGPYPPPHGGISVHVSGIQKQLTAAGIRCAVLNTERIRPGLRFGAVLLRYAWRGWTLHLHTNGHNWKSWLLALGCGLAGQGSGGGLLTLHSGMLPAYLEEKSGARRALAGTACRLYRRIICVSPKIQTTLVDLGVPTQRTEVVPAALMTERPRVVHDRRLLVWLGRHWPLFSTAMFFRPEYGFDVLIEALVRLRARYPSLGCVVMGSGEQRAEAEKRIQEAGLEINVLIAGDVEHEVCLSLIATSQVFLRCTTEDGDSISVREALALGVPVVASRVGMRPDGAILFRPGDAEEMAAKVEQALSAGRASGAPASDCMDRLMAMYQKAAA